MVLLGRPFFFPRAKKLEELLVEGRFLLDVTPRAL